MAQFKVFFYPLLRHLRVKKTFLRQGSRPEKLDPGIISPQYILHFNTQFFYTDLSHIHFADLSGHCHRKL